MHALLETLDKLELRKIAEVESSLGLVSMGIHGSSWYGNSKESQLKDISRIVASNYEGFERSSEFNSWSKKSLLSDRYSVLVLGLVLVFALS